MRGRRCVALLLVCLAQLFARYSCSQQAEPRTVRVAVLSLFHPEVLALLCGREARLDGDALPGQRFTIRRVADGELEVRDGSGVSRRGERLTVAGGSVSLRVQGKRTTLQRTWVGSLAVDAQEGELRAVVGLGTELAVASIVQAEAPPRAGAEMLRAQAVAARSYLLANLHPDAPADTCDTTHCQLMQAAAATGSAAELATAATAGTVLVWQPPGLAEPRLVPAVWTPSCSGRTRAGHARSPNDYPFFAVDCLFCQRHPERWSQGPGVPVPASEAARIAWNREHPGQVLPSPTMHRTADGLEGLGTGHGQGLCQRGSAQLAREGWRFPEILAHYFPNTFLVRLKPSP